MNDKTRQLNALTFFTYNVVFTNDMACGAIVQCVSDIRHSKYYKFEVKKLTNELHTLRVGYERRMKHITEKYVDDFIEMCDSYTDAFQKDSNLLYFAMKQSMDNIRIEDSALMARMQQTRVWLQIAKEIYFDRTSFLKKKCVLPVNSSLGYLDPSAMYNKINFLIDKHFSHTNNVIFPNGQIVVDTILRKLSDKDLLEKCLR